MSWKIEIIALLASIFLLNSCGQDPVPKPRGYFRLALPEKAYRTFDPPCPYKFDVPEQAIILPSRSAEDSCWLNVHMPKYKQTIHITYKEVGADLFQLIEDAHGFKSKHQVKADRVENIRVINSVAKVYGNIFNIEGNVASPMQFYLTDSVEHFVYGAMYFNMVPNADSLDPVIQRSKEDLQYLVESFRWTDQPY